MKIAFVSNYINHHQLPFSNRMYELLGEDYTFIQTEPMEEERVRMGWHVELDQIPYLLELEKDEALCRQKIAEADAVIFGGTERQELITERLDAGKLTLIYSERIYKEGQWKCISPRGLCKKYKDHTCYRKKPVFLLCSGAYVASDFRIIRAYPDKKFKWGYFPAFQEEDIETLIAEKERKIRETDCIELMWSGRMIDWKHPEYAIEAVRCLKEEGYQVHLTMVGGGEMEDLMHQMADEYKLNEDITFTGFLKPEQVREQMKKSSIYLFTSNYLEGWGAVVNEAMNSGCAVVASHAAGAPGFLIQEGYNGFLYKNGKFKKMYEKIKILLNNEKARVFLAQKAYNTVAYSWNANVAADRILVFCERYLTTGRAEYETEGILSKAQAILPARMYHYLTR